jgi:hypothetical protein
MHRDVNRSTAARRGIIALVAAGSAVLSCGCHVSDGRTLTLIPAEMKVSGPHTKEPHGAIAFWGNGSLAAHVNLHEGTVQITIFARGNRVQGEWPKLYVELGSRVVASVTIDASEITNYTVQVQVSHAAASSLRVALVNYVGVAEKLLESRNVLIEKIIVRPL